MTNFAASTARLTSAATRYGLAVSLTLGALLITLLLSPTRLPSPLFLLAVLLSAWIGGIGPGLAAAVLATLALAYFFLPPTYSFAFDPAELPHLLVFFVCAVVVSWWSAVRRRAEDALRQARDELDARVDERTADLAHTNQQLQAQIAERKRIEMTLREQASLLSLAHDAIIVRDAQSRITFWNPGAEKTYGWTAEQAIGKVSHDLLRTRFSVSREAVDDALAEHAEWEGELTHKTRQGTVIVVMSRQSLRRDEHGAGTAILEINRDITVRRQAEYLTRQVFEMSPDGVSVVGRDYRYRRVNPVYERNWAMPAERIVGMHVADLLGTQVFAQTIKPNLDRCFAGEQVSFAEWFTSAHGRFYLSVTYSPLRLDSERVDAALVVTRDLTEHMLAVEALRATEAELARVNRVTTLGVLAASIAHEVNQPLGAMVTSADSCSRWLAAQPPDFDKAQRALERIAKDGRRASEVIDRIRSLVKRQAPQEDSVDINQTVLEVIALVHDQVRSHDISLETRLAPDLPPVQGDRVQLQQVMLNLIVNAIEAMSVVADRLRQLTIASTNDGPKEVRLEVRDSGPGLNRARAEELFEPFYTTKTEGLGMGLSISRSIIEGHGGRLWATANEPHGAVFQFTLPIDEADSHPADAGGS